MREVIVTQPLDLGKDSLFATATHWNGAEIIIGGREFFARYFVFLRPDGVTLLFKNRFLTDFQADKISKYPFETLVILSDALHARLMRDEVAEVGVNLDFQNGRRQQEMLYSILIQ